MDSTLATSVRHNMRTLTVRPATAGLTGRPGVSSRRTARVAAVHAGQGDAQERDEQKVVQKVVISAISAVAAVTLALTGPVSAIELPPRNAAPDLSLAKDDEFLGKAFQKAGVPGNAPKAAENIKSKLSGAEPQGAKDAKSAGKDVGKKAQKASLSDLTLAKDDEFLGKAFQKAGVPGNAPKAAENIKSKLSGAEPQGAKDAKDVGKGVAGKAQKAALSDLSLAKDDEFLGNAFQKAGIPGNAPKAAENVKSKLSGIEPQGAKDAKGAGKDAGKDVASKAQKASLSDLSLAKDDEFLGNAFEKAGVPGNAPEAAESIKSKLSGAEPQGAKDAKGAASDAAKNVASKAQRASLSDLSLGKDDKFLGNAFQKAGVPGNAPKAAESVKSKVSGAEPKGAKDAKSAAVDAAKKAKKAVSGK